MTRSHSCAVRVSCYSPGWNSRFSRLRASLVAWACLFRSLSAFPSTAVVHSDGYSHASLAHINTALSVPFTITGMLSSSLFPLTAHFLLSPSWRLAPALGPFGSISTLSLVGNCRVILYDNQIFPVLPINEGRELPGASPLSSPYDRYMEETACRKPQKAERRLYRASRSEFVQYFVVL